MKKNKNIIIMMLCAILVSAALNTNAQQATPSNFYAQNAWMPDSNATQFLNGKLYSGYNLNLIKQSNTKLIRYGGSTAQSTMPTKFQYLKMVDSIRAKGMEPILQVPFKPNFAYDSAAAIDIVTYINLTKGKKVKYWAIGNEPDLKYNFQQAMLISDYIKRISRNMKKLDSTIRIIGPSLSRYSIDGNEAHGKMCDTLTSYATTGLKAAHSIMGNIGTGYGIASNLPYIDYFSYHMYNSDSAATSTQSRNWFIKRLTEAGKDTSRMGRIKRRLDSVNVQLGRTSRPVKPIITEANICLQGDGSQPAWDTFAGKGASGFFAGQHWCEMMSYGINKKIEWINFWATTEGNEQGYLTHAQVGVKKSTFYHMEQMAKWFKGTHHIATVDSSGSARPTIKAFASVTSSYIAVMVINQDVVGSGYRKYNISFDNTANGANVHVKFNLGYDWE